MTGTAILLRQRLTALHVRFGLSEDCFCSAEAPQAISGTNQRWIEEKRRFEIDDGLVIPPLRLVNIAAVVIGEGVDGVEGNGSGVVVDRTRQIA